MAEIAVRIENGARKQPVAEFIGDELTSMEMPGQDEVITALPRRFPDTRIMRAQDANIPVRHRRSRRTGYPNHAITVVDLRGGFMNPLATTPHDRLANSIHSQSAVVVSTDGQDRRYFAQPADQVLQAAQLRRLIYQVAT